MTLNLIKLIAYFTTLSVNFHDINALWGFFALIAVFSQLISGTMLSFSLIPEPMIIPLARDEEDSESKLIDLWFWAHERGVDLVFIFSYLHLFRKIYLNICDYEHENTWKSGTWTFLILQLTVFFGLVLCGTHLSEITLTIASNIMHTFFMFYGKPYWWLFTDKQLNSDTMIRLAYGHYCAAFFMAYLGVLHGIDMHYDWKSESSFDGIETETGWWEEALSNELNTTSFSLFILTLFCYFFFPYPEALSYELFMWGDIGFINDIRFYGVAPHWYFRALMAWLLVCPFHKMGIAGLILFFISLFFQPNLYMNSDLNMFSKKIFFFLKKFSSYTPKEMNIEFNIIYQTVYFYFFMAGLYTFSFLPYGRFYNRLGGNFAMLIAYSYLFGYLIFVNIRRPIFLEFIYYNIYVKCLNYNLNSKKLNNLKIN